MNGIYILIITALLVSGCAPRQYKAEPKSNFAKIWPLQMQGKYLQQIKVTARGQQHDFNVHLNVNANMIHIIAFNDIIGRLYSLTASPNGTIWERNPMVPNFIQPDNIILDFLLAHLSKDELNTCMHDLTLTQTAESRTIKQGNDVIREISRSTKIGDSWERIVIKNSKLDYVIDITTVQL